MKTVTLFLLSAMLLCLATGVGYWAFKYYGTLLPMFPDNTDYETMELRAEAAQRYAQRHRLDEDYCLFIDYGIPSGTPRLFVWSFREQKVVARTYVMHGPGMGSTVEQPVFSNRPGSNCSSLGRFVVTKQHGHKLRRSYRISGLDYSNKTAFDRGLMIHRSTWVDRNCWRQYIPLHAPSCRGCVTVSSPGMTYLERLIEHQPKRLLLWSYCTKQNP